MLPQIVQQLNQALVVRRLINHIMECHICLCKLLQIIRLCCLQHLFKAARCLIKLLQFALCNPLTRQFYRQLLQSKPHLQHIVQVFFRDLCYLRTLPRHHDHKAVQLQHTDRLADRGTRNAELICQPDLHQPFTRL